MNKKWDYDVPSVEFWTEVYRVLKPGGHVLSFGGTRTYHRMVVNIEDAGFEIRDQIQWIYGSGFPKSHNIGKAVDKLEGNEREDLGKNPAARPCSDAGDYETNTKWKTPPRPNISKGTSPYEGWGTALKPANEPICVARKPLSEKTIAENVMKWGTGGINIDGCRVGTDPISHGTSKIDFKNNKDGNKSFYDNAWQGGKSIEVEEIITEGRFPANIILDEIAGEILDEQSEGSSRFFYQAKVSKAERNMGLDEFEDKGKGWSNHLPSTTNGTSDVVYERSTTTKNSHPTVKPINLMAYLCRLITPEGGICLDPFMGSGSTGIASQLEGFRFVGMEMDSDYFKIAEARIDSYEKYKKFIK
jgi:site-specific DNA-methyltransferase (adenine-specific)